jgi:sugar lactone lactonase YvrE
VEWALAPGSPGSLAQTSGNSVEYVPPPTGTVIVNNIVNVIANTGDVTTNVTIVLSGNANVNNGTVNAVTITPPAPPSQNSGTPNTPVPPSPGIYLIAGNDFGAGIANGTGTSARFDTQSAIARDAQGTLYVADSANYVIRKISAQGVVTTLAGMPGVRGNVDAQGSAARFSRPSGIAVDSSGNIYVAETENATIRKITPDGTVTTLAGSPGESGTTDGLGTAARFSTNSKRIAVDLAGNVYVTEMFCIRKITPAGQVTTIASQCYSAGSVDGPAADARFSYLKGIAVDNAGNVYVVDGGVSRIGSPPNTALITTAAIRKITVDGIVSTVAGATMSFPIGTREAGSALEGGAAALGFVDGKGAEARFRFPEGLTIDRAGNLFVSDRGNQAIRRITPDGVVTTVVGAPGEGGSVDGAIADARLMAPTGITVDADGILYITDDVHHTIRKIIPGSSVTTLAGAAPQSGSANGTGASARFNGPRGITRDASGNLFVADTLNRTVRRIGTDGIVSTFAGSPGQIGTTDGIGAAARFAGPLGLAADLTGNIFVSDVSRNIRRITSAGSVSTYAQSIYSPGVAVDRNGDVFVTSYNAVVRLGPQFGIVAGDTRMIGTADGVGTAARFVSASGVAADTVGNLYVIDNGSAIRKISPAGSVSTLAGAQSQYGTQDGTGTAARFNFPQSLTVDGDGNIYIAETYAIRKITPLGIVTTVAGASVSGQGNGLSNIYKPLGLVMTGPKTLAFTSGNGVFELRLP